MGATFAGPWGAAVGGAIGLAKGLVTGLLDSEKAAEKARKAIEKEAEAYWAQVDAAERAKTVAASLASAQSDLAEAERQATEAAQTHHQILNEAPEAFRRAADKARAYQDQLVDINSELRKMLGLDPIAGKGFHGDLADTQSTDAATATRAARGLRDADLEKYAATKAYGAALQDLAGAENSRNDRLRDLEQIMGDVNVTQDVQSRALKEYNQLVGAATKETHALVRELQDADTWMRAIGRANQTSDFDGLLKGHLGFGPRSQNEKQENPGVDFAATQDRLRAARQGILEMQTESKRASDKIAADAKKAADETSAAWGTSLGEIGKSFIDAAIEGQQSFSEMTEHMLKDIAKLIVKMAALQAIKSGVSSGALSSGQGAFLTGLTGLLGFAHGGVIYEGSGGTDSQLVAFRKSPNERVTIETPQQVGNGELRGGGGSGGVTVVNQYSDDPRALRESMNTRGGTRVIHNQMRRLRT
jgi:hypothetical protein